MGLQLRTTWYMAAPRPDRRTSSKTTARVCWSSLLPFLQPQAISLGGTRSFSNMSCSKLVARTYSSYEARASSTPCSLMQVISWKVKLLTRASYEAMVGQIGTLCKSEEGCGVSNLIGGSKKPHKSFTAFVDSQVL